MAEPTLAEIFGIGTTQTATTLTISKSELVALGLTLSDTNSAESLLAAILKLCQISLSPTKAANNPDQSITVSDTPASLVTIGANTSYRKNIIISFGAVTNAAGITPDAY
jgi:hypothetical protein